jgi:hypothetical protein
MPVNPKLVDLGVKALIALASDPEMVGRFLDKAGKMPNIDMPTMGGKVFWTDLAEHKGWRLQKNDVFGNCRILNPGDERIAWGGEAEMVELLKSVSI